MAKVPCPLCKGAGKVNAGEIGLGDRIRALRGSETQSEFAKKLRISRAQLANIESNRTRPGIEVASELADLTGVTLDYIFRGKGEEKSDER